MDEETQNDELLYAVVVNDEEQYSIWPQGREVPLGWREEGVRGSKQECLAHINEVWTDMRPLSLRRHMEEMARRAEESGVGPGEAPLPDVEEPTLVDRLSQGTHPVEASLRPDRSAGALREAIDRGYVFVKFTRTRGGTELGVRLDSELTELAEADFEAQTGRLRLVGNLTLDFVPVRCIADLDLETLAGEGRLEVLSAEARPAS